MTEGLDAIALAQAEERLRQEQAIFKLNIEQHQSSFRQRQTIGWIVIALFVAICAFCGFVLVNHGEFSGGTVTAATSALLVEALGLVGAVIKGTMGAAPKALEPTTARPEIVAPRQTAERRTR
jgi:hypothetical protein